MSNNQNTGLHSKIENEKVEEKGIKLHLGCGENILPDFLNCDIQEYPGVGKVMDCSDLSSFKENSIESIFNSAFFEHLWLNQQLPFLNGCHRVLKDDGVLIMLGVPDFEQIARCYLEKSPILSPYEGIFDLYCAYRLTHGDCESSDDVSIPQMHKTIFDKGSLKKLFELTKFKHFKVFSYTFSGEQQPLALGVIARKDRDFKPDEPKTILKRFSYIFDNLDSVII